MAGEFKLKLIPGLMLLSLVIFWILVFQGCREVQRMTPEEINQALIDCVNSGGIFHVTNTGGYCE